MRSNSINIKSLVIVFLMSMVSFWAVAENTDSTGSDMKVEEKTSTDKIKITKEDYSNNSVEMADTFRGEGKIYIVVGVILIIFIGLVVYLVMTDKKVKRLEEEIKYIKK